MLPYLTPDLPGSGGHLRAVPAHFVVQEVPLYPASGDGDHLYVTLTRSGHTTRQVTEQLAHLFGLRLDDVGYAGLKDKQAQATQTFSLLALPGRLPGYEQVAERITQQLGYPVHQVRRHRNKLKAGHLRGNQFTITISDVDGAAVLPQAQDVLDEMLRRGLPNYFGEQRFGHEGGNVEQGKQALKGHGPRERWLRRFVISAFQSHLFNLYLAERLQDDLFDRLLAGDVAKKQDTGGLFDVQDVETEQARYQRGEIHFTGPMYGSKMRTASGEAGERETRVLAESGVSAEDFRRARIEGTRRAGRVAVENAGLEVVEEGLRASFFLPKGAFATTLLREIMKNEASGGIQEVDEEA